MYKNKISLSICIYETLIIKIIMIALSLLYMYTVDYKKRITYTKDTEISDE